VVNSVMSLEKSRVVASRYANKSGLAGVDTAMSWTSEPNASVSQ